MPRFLKIFKILIFILSAILTLNLLLLLQNSKVEKRPNKGPKSCGRFPADSEIIRDNEFWQEMKMSNETVKLFNAYLDTRMNKTFVRVNVNSIHLNITHDTIFCQFWFEEYTKPYVVKALNYTYLWGDGL
jgi:hypothetical protein